MRRLAPCLLLVLLVNVPAAAQTDMPGQSPTLEIPLDACPIPPIAPLPDPGLLPQGLVDGLLDWIAEATEYDVAPIRDDPPQVTFCSPGDLIEYQDIGVYVGSDLHGLYDSRFRRIVLVRPWSADDPRDRALLLHELAHRVQLANRAWDCPQAPEREAYHLQARYLTEHGIDPGFDWAHIDALADCANEPSR